MKSYHAKDGKNLVEALEGMEIEGAHYALLRLRADAPKEFAHSLLAHLPGDAMVVSDVASETGERTVLCKMQGSPEALRELLERQGEPLVEDHEKSKSFNPWFWRGATSILGQSLQIVSSLTTFKPENIGADGHAAVKADGAIFGFAALNLMANACNMSFGSQHKRDEHQLRYLKEEFNRQWQPYAIEGKNLPTVEGKANLRREQEDLTFGQQVHGFLKEQSVTFGELWLRILGTTSLIAPITKWPEAFEYVMQGNVAKAAGAAINPDKSTLAVGVTMMVGKVSGLLAKEEDPYNPKPKSAVDQFREKIAFKLSSVIEGGAATYMMWDRYQNKRSVLGHDGDMNEPGFQAGPNETAQQVRARPESYMNQLRPDWAGTAGNLAFVDGYIMRYFAKVGSLDVDMKELTAHVSDGLATLPKDMIPDALAATAMGLKLHFHDKKEITAGGIYDAVAADLERQHIIDVGAIRLANARTEGGARSAQPARSSNQHLPEAGEVVETSYHQTVLPKAQHALV